MVYRPGDNWVICDFTGQKVLMSETVKTWDGYRVKRDWFYPRHPQLDVKGIPELSMRVIDGRPEQEWQFAYPSYGSGPLVAASPNGTIYQITVSNAGAVGTIQQPFQPYANPAIVNGFQLEVSNTGVITTEAVEGDQGPPAWVIVSPNGTVWELKVPSGVPTATVLA